MEVLSSDNYEKLQFDALTDLFVEIGVKLKNFIFANHERARLNMKKQTEEIRKKYDFFDDEDDKKMLKKKESDTEMDETETIPYPYQRGKMTLMIVKQLSVLPQKGKVKMKLMKKYIKNQSLKLSLRLKNKL